MAQITAKELTALSDLLGMEQLITQKYHCMASTATDAAIQDRYEQMAARHQRHFDELYSNLK